ncbi:MAG TPA: hypothetical protein VEB20_15205 [Azospirillaceae bacterium]|nr:hypothetical protein [Azospirillaceae bacterium]
MSSVHKQAMELVLKAAEQDIAGTMEERGVKDKYSDDGDEVVFDVAILHAYRIFVRICESQGFKADAAFFSDMASELADDMAQEAVQGE